MSKASEDATEVEDERLRSALRGALRGEGDAPDVLAGFQKKVRERSEGKFYADGWSTARNPPVNTYFVTSLLMLLALGIIYALLAPLSGDPAKVENEAAPVNVVAPAPVNPVAPAPNTSAAH
jgi:hypothetical protein